MKMIQFQSKTVPIFPGHFFVIMRIRYEGLKLYKIKADFATAVEISVFKFGPDLVVFICILRGHKLLSSAAKKIEVWWHRVDFLPRTLSSSSAVGRLIPKITEQP